MPRGADPAPTSRWGGALHWETGGWEAHRATRGAPFRKGLGEGQRAALRPGPTFRESEAQSQDIFPRGLGAGSASGTSATPPLTSLFSLPSQHTVCTINTFPSVGGPFVLEARSLEKNVCIASIHGRPI